VAADGYKHNSHEMYKMLNVRTASLAHHTSITHSTDCSTHKTRRHSESAYICQV